jgi:hypothetical protein
MANDGSLKISIKRHITFNVCGMERRKGRKDEGESRERMQ